MTPSPHQLVMTRLATIKEEYLGWELVARNEDDSDDARLVALAKQECLAAEQAFHVALLKDMLDESDRRHGLPAEGK